MIRTLSDIKKLLDNKLIKPFLKKGWDFASNIDDEIVYLKNNDNYQVKINLYTQDIVYLDPHGYLIEIIK